MVFFTGRGGERLVGLRMNIAPYPFVRIVGNMYQFISVGKKEVQKVVQFTSLADSNVYNMCLGDLLPDGGIDDLVNTNNGDIVKVFATAIAAAIHFLERMPEVLIFFTGSTESRTDLYAEILRRNYWRYKDRYIVYAVFWQQDELVEIEFDPELKHKYLEYYLCKRN